MKKKKLIFFILLSLAGCTGGGVGAGARDSASDSPIEFLPYEVLKNALISSLEVTDSSDCVQDLEDNKAVFGAFVPGSGRSLGFSLTRFRLMASIADTCCANTIQNRVGLIFDPNDPTAPDKLWKRVVGRSLTETERNGFTNLMAIQGYSNTVERQQAICVTTLNTLAAQLK